MKKHGFKQGQVDPDIFISKSNELIRQLRVAAYCRVSSKEDQANSYEVQKEYYTDKIMSNPAWTMTGIFADKGITVIFEKENINSLEEDSELRRMRYFYRMYGDTPELLAAAMRLNWTQNVVIMEAGLTMDERCWYIRKAAERGVSKTELLRVIERAEHSEIALGENEDTCYNVENDEFSEKNRYEEYPVYLPWKHLPQSRGAAAYQSGLRQVRPADRHGQRESTEYAPHLRRLCRQLRSVFKKKS